MFQAHNYNVLTIIVCNL